MDSDFTSELVSCENGAATYRIRSKDAPEPDGFLEEFNKVWLVVEPGQSTWIVVYFQSVVYVNGVPRVIAFPSDKISARIGKNGKQSLTVARYRKRAASVDTLPKGQGRNGLGAEQG